jgi:hypothetical protein
MSTVPNPPSPSAGWATPEHFQAIVKQVLSLLVILGVLQTADADSAQSQLAACITAGFVFALNAWQVVTFLKGQVTLKLHGKGGTGGLPFFLLAALVLALTAAPGSAQCPCPCGPGCVGSRCPGGNCYLSPAGVYPAALLPWRSQLDKQMQQHQQMLRDLQGQRQGPAPQPIIIQAPAPSGPIAYGPQQTLPILGAPLQQLPLQGAPQQTLPIAGQPHMLLPIEGNPHLLVPILGSPKQQLPVAPQQPPQQALPVAPLPPSPPRTMPPASGAPSQPQTYTVRAYALYRFQER